MPEQEPEKVEPVLEEDDVEGKSVNILNGLNGYSIPVVAENVKREDKPTHITYEININLRI